VLNFYIGAAAIGSGYVKVSCTLFIICFALEYFSNQNEYFSEQDFRHFLPSIIKWLLRLFFFVCRYEVILKK
jgi:hypothetical protein